MGTGFVICWGLAGVGVGALLAVRRVGWIDPTCTPATTQHALLTGALFAATVGHLADAPAVLAFSYLMAVGVAACAVDLAEQRLPSELTLPSYLVVGGCVLAAAATDGDVALVLRVAAAATACFAFHLLLALISAGGLGAGDCKLAGALGLATGWLGWTAMLSAVFLAWAFAAVAVLLRPRAARGRRLVMGPFLFAGFAAVALTTG